MTVRLWRVLAGLSFGLGIGLVLTAVAAGLDPALMAIGGWLCVGPVALHVPRYLRPLVVAEAARGKPIEDADPFCSCGSEEPAEPVTVEYTAGKPEIVAHLCPGCTRPRTPRQVSTAANNDLGYADAVKALNERTKVLDTLLADVQRDDGNFPLTQEQYARVVALTEECKRLRERIPNKRPTEIEGVCADEGHEWESISTWGSAVPIRKFCTRCTGGIVLPEGMTVTPIIGGPDSLGRRPDSACVACSGQGARFGYRCDPCGGTGRR